MPINYNILCKYQEVLQVQGLNSLGFENQWGSQKFGIIQHIDYAMGKGTKFTPLDKDSIKQVKRLIEENTGVDWNVSDWDLPNKIIWSCSVIINSIGEVSFNTALKHYYKKQYASAVKDIMLKGNSNNSAINYPAYKVAEMLKKEYLDVVLDVIRRMNEDDVFSHNKSIHQC